jgi:multidrug/hemolysin transport system ATP-binding protein
MMLPKVDIFQLIGWYKINIENIYLKGVGVMKNIIEINNLHKSYGDVKAVSNLSFCVNEGELFAFLGVNGAGKSTTINIMCAQLTKDSGEISIDGLNLDENVDEIKNKLGVVFQNSVLDAPLTVYDNLESRAALYGIVGEEFENRLNELVQLLNFKDLLKRKIRNLSGGQKRRIDIARALIHKPKILILDEPTTGLDPQTRKTLWSVISSLRKNEKMTVFLTTHYMEEAADADYVVIIDDGQISAKGTPLELKNTYTGDFITLYCVAEDVVKELGVEYEVIRDAVRIFVPNTAKATELILKYPNIFIDYEVTKGKMDDVFLSVTGKKLTGGEE